MHCNLSNFEYYYLKPIILNVDMLSVMMLNVLVTRVLMKSKHGRDW
jgi:hypothetical protein